MITEIDFLTKQLVEKCKAGDRKSQFEIYKMYYKAMYNTCFRIVKNTIEAEDIMQEAFLTAFSKINTFRGEVSFGAWLKRIVINKALDTIKKKRILTDELDAKANKLIDCDENQFFESQNLEIERIRKGILQLADGYRIVLSLNLLEGYDYEEIAEIMQISESTVRSQFARGRKKLIELLNPK